MLKRSIAIMICILFVPWCFAEAPNTVPCRVTALRSFQYSMPDIWDYEYSEEFQMHYHYENGHPLLGGFLSASTYEFKDFSNLGTKEIREIMHDTFLEEFSQLMVDGKCTDANIKPAQLDDYISVSFSGAFNEYSDTLGVDCLLYTYQFFSDGYVYSFLYGDPTVSSDTSLSDFEDILSSITPIVTESSTVFDFRGIPLGSSLSEFRDALAADICPQSMKEKDWAFSRSIRETNYINYYADDYLFFDSASAFGKDYTFYQMQLVPEDGITVAGYDDFTVLAYAIPAVEDGLISPDPEDSIVINSQYSMFCDSSIVYENIRADMLDKLVQLYGSYSDYSSSPDNNQHNYVWYGAENTYLKLNPIYYPEENSGIICIEYGLTNVPELLDELKDAAAPQIDPLDDSGL